MVFPEHIPPFAQYDSHDRSTKFASRTRKGRKQYKNKFWNKSTNCTSLFSTALLLTGSTDNGLNLKCLNWSGIANSLLGIENFIYLLCPSLFPLTFFANNISTRWAMFVSPSCLYTSIIYNCTIMIYHVCWLSWIPHCAIKGGTIRPSPFTRVGRWAFQIQPSSAL